MSPLLPWLSVSFNILLLFLIGLSSTGFRWLICCFILLQKDKDFSYTRMRYSAERMEWIVEGLQRWDLWPSSCAIWMWRASRLRMLPLETRVWAECKPETSGDCVASNLRAAPFVNCIYPYSYHSFVELYIHLSMYLFTSVQVPCSARSFSSMQCPDQLWGPTSLLSNRYLGLFPSM
jgi:hypothetical protein